MYAISVDSDPGAEAGIKSIVSEERLIGIINDGVRAPEKSEEIPVLVCSLQPCDMAGRNWLVGALRREPTYCDSGEALQVVQEVCSMLARVYDVGWYSIALH